MKFIKKQKILVTVVYSDHLVFSMCILSKKKKINKGSALHLKLLIFIIINIYNKKIP